MPQQLVSQRLFKYLGRSVQIFKKTQVCKHVQFLKSAYQPHGNGRFSLGYFHPLLEPSEQQTLVRLASPERGSSVLEQVNQKDSLYDMFKLTIICKEEHSRLSVTRRVTESLGTRPSTIRYRQPQPQL